MAKKERPLGVTIIAFLQIIGAIIAAAIVIAVPIFLYNIEMTRLLDDPMVKLYFIYVIIMIPIYSILAVGLLKGIYITSVITIILHIISIITSLIRFNIVSVFISLIIIYYLTRPHVKEYFLLD